MQLAASLQQSAISVSASSGRCKLMSICHNVYVTVSVHWPGALSLAIWRCVLCESWQLCVISPSTLRWAVASPGSRVQAGPFTWQEIWSVPAHSFTPDPAKDIKAWTLSYNVWYITLEMTLPRSCTTVTSPVDLYYNRLFVLLMITLPHNHQNKRFHNTLMVEDQSCIYCSNFISTVLSTSIGSTWAYSCLQAFPERFSTWFHIQLMSVFSFESAQLMISPGVWVLVLEVCVNPFAWAFVCTSYLCSLDKE